ncbi:MAG TPA: hypothetical protein VNS22_01985 [Geminicoccus sp.]|uniref:hypothetical protein n=1 Tax=Geminicoccus sp. TaxID=2024832 RepID=UPI002C03FA97|nr:hypothetical protein [Geminicoccus sp.]HWL67133.1 hypothetical protein [Geminicoccus sp.]
MPTLAQVRTLVHDLIKPGLEELGDIVGSKQQIASREAVVMLTAIGLQESALTHRRQLHDADPGPGVDLQPIQTPGLGAYGLWGFEYSGIRLTLRHAKVRALRNIIEALTSVGLDPDPDARSANASRIMADDKAALWLARLYLLTDNQALSLDADEMWVVYKRVWNPGKPRPEHWPANFKLALDAYPEKPLPLTKRGAGMILTGVSAAVTYGPDIVHTATGMKAIQLGPTWQTIVGVMMAAGMILTLIGTIRARKATGK